MANKIEPFINEKLLELVREARETTMDTVSLADLETEKARHLSELCRIVSNYDEDEMIVCIATILDEHSKLIFQVMETERQHLRKGKKHDDNRGN